MGTLKYYLHHHSFQSGCKISLVDTNLDNYKVKELDIYKFEVYHKFTPIAMTCSFLGKGLIDGQETLGFRIIDSRTPK